MTDIINNISNNPDQQTTKTLLEGLVQDISSKYQIEQKQVKKFIENETITSIQTLKQELEKQNIQESFTDPKQLEKLYFTLKGAKEIINKQTSFEIQSLQVEMKNNTEILAPSEMQVESLNTQAEKIQKNTDNYIESPSKELLKKVLGANKLFQKAENPEKPHEHILGIALGTAESIIATADFCYQIGTGVIKAPYHIYLLLSNKAKNSKIKKI